MTHTSVDNDITRKIIAQVYRVLSDLSAPPSLLAIIGSWGDTLDDDEILGLLSAYSLEEDDDPRSL